jgi:hypothetical protein
LANSKTATKRDVNARTAQLVKLLTEVGPDIPEISRRLNQFKESVRYRYKEKIVNRGFAVQAAVDHEKLGLKRLIVLVDFAEEYRRYSQAILTAMNGLCYLVSYSKTLPLGMYVANFSAPVEYAEDVKLFLRGLQDKGMFTRLEIMEFEWLRRSPMRAESYNFDTGRWEFDWSNPSAAGFESAKYTPSTPTRFDYVDLLLIKEMQMNANKTLREISDNLKLNYKKLAWHYSAHVKGRQLLHGFTVNWMGTRYDYKIEKALHRKHRYMALNLLVKNTTEYELISIREATNRLPFLWSEAVGKNYYSEFAFPMDFAVEGIQYIAKLIENVRNRSELFIGDQSESLSFTIPYSMYDYAHKRWMFDAYGLSRRFDNLIMQIKNGPT